MQKLALYTLQRHNDIAEIQRIKTNPPGIKFDYDVNVILISIRRTESTQGTDRSYVTHLTRLFFKEPT